LNLYYKYVIIFGGRMVLTLL